MLKVDSKSTKCAEILYNSLIEQQFSIICICGISIHDYSAFTQHFLDKHLAPEAPENVNKSTDEVKKLPKETEGAECLEEPLLLLTPTQPESEHDTLTAATSKTLPDEPARCPQKQRNKLNVCTYCGRTFRRRYLLDTHLNIHTGRKPHQCEMCGKQFRATSTLTRHLRTHEQRQKLQCKHCEKHFTHRSALLSHEMRHTQVRRWGCNSCGKSFYTSNQLDTHQRKLHAQSTDKDNAMGDCNATDLPFACELCGNCYRSASMLSTHRLKKHYRLAKYCCEQCDKKFVDADGLQQHQLIHVKRENQIQL